MVKVRKKIQKKKKVLVKAKQSFGKVHRTKIKVIGIGGGGSSIISEISPQVKKVDFTVANVDLQALKTAARGVKRFQFGENLTGGLGCGMNPELGRQAAEDCKEKIKRELENVDFCIIIACLGGGTGSGAGPVFAEVANSLKKKTFGIFTLPFKFEGEKRAQIARESLEKLKPNLNAFVVIPNEKIFQIIEENTPFKESLSAVNKILAQSLRSLIEMIYAPGLINIDFADLKTILERKGKLAYLNSAEAQGENRTEEALRRVLTNPLTEYDIKGAERILFNVTAPKDLGMLEMGQISKTISDFNKSAKTIFGISENKKYNNKIRITLLAVGCGEGRKTKTVKKKSVAEEETKITKKKDGKNAKKGTKKLKKKSSERTQPQMSQPPPKKKPKKTKLKKESGSKPKVKPTMKTPKKTKKKREKKELLKADSQSANKTPTIPSLAVEPPTSKRIRRSALELKKDIEQAEKEILEEEKKWEIPAFLRRKKTNP